MGQCHHLESSGRQCPRVAAEGDLFCRVHGGRDTAGLNLVAWRRLVFRIAAAVLLLLFALQCYLLLKATLTD